MFLFSDYVAVLGCVENAFDVNECNDGKQNEIWGYDVV